MPPGTNVLLRLRMLHGELRTMSNGVDMQDGNVGFLQWAVGIVLAGLGAWNSYLHARFDRLEDSMSKKMNVADTALSERIDGVDDKMTDFERETRTFRETVLRDSVRKDDIARVERAIEDMRRVVESAATAAREAAAAATAQAALFKRQ